MNQKKFEHMKHMKLSSQSVTFRILLLPLAAFLVLSVAITACGGDRPDADGPDVADERADASPKHDFADEPCFISMWNHRRDLDPSDLVARLGINHIWSHDDAYHGQEWEDTHMYRLLQIPGVDYVMAKVERAAWGWDHEMSLRHAKWVAELSKEHPGIAGMYLNDFYDEVEDGYRTEEQWREIIDATKSINPDLKLWVPHYPHRDQGRHAFDFDIDGVILNLWGNEPELMAQAKEHLAAGLAHHPDRPVIAGLYLQSGMDGGRWLTEDEFRFVYGHYVDMLNAGQLKGVRIFAAYQLMERPEYIEWAKEILESVTCR